MLFGLGDIRMRRMFIDDEEASPEHKRRAHGRLDTLIGYCETAQCRRQILLQLFRRKRRSLAAIATIAWTRRRARMATEEARIILAAVAQTGERFGAGAYRRCAARPRDAEGAGARP